VERSVEIAIGNRSTEGVQLRDVKARGLFDHIADAGERAARPGDPQFCERRVRVVVLIRCMAE